MKDFLEYSPEDVILANLRESSKRNDMLMEQELAHLRELANEILSVGDLQEILLSLPDRRPPAVEPYDDALEQNKLPLSALHRFTRAQRSMLLSSMLGDLLVSRKNLSLDAFFSDAEQREKSEFIRVAYPKSGYADSAYLSFSSLVNDAHVVYTHSFISACEEVYNGLCDYCILPLENSTEGMLAGFLRLIVRYDLKIAATCEITSREDLKTTRFALLRKELLPLSEPDGSELFFTMLLPVPDELSHVLGAATFFEHSPRTIFFLPNDAEKGIGGVYLTFSLQPKNLYSFLLYLAMELPYYTPMGFHPNIYTLKKGR
ncbi:MAG: hypothetical protein E7643_00790 [Ruminococcaceae bacterium]|nr:hypothetical protein [Oscillospiraceae bacterium]